MLTPSFELSQNDDFLFVNIQIPYAKISEIEVNFEDNYFLFYSKPYYLRLNLPAKVLYCEAPEINYDIDKKMVTVKVPKKEPGEKFEGLDLLTSLLNPKKKPLYKKTPLIEVIDENTDEKEQSDEAQNYENFDLSFEQVPIDLGFKTIAPNNEQCGFANLHSFSVFNLKEETAEIFDLKEPQCKTDQERLKERLKCENEKFDEEHYLADLYDDQEIQAILNYPTWWQCLYSTADWTASQEDKIIFTREEKDRLRALPNKEYLLDKYQVKSLLLGLIDIIFSYTYNYKTTQGENTVESAWTINKLSATLSWLETFSSVSEVARTCIRRSLCYPLYRHFGLTIAILDDVRQIFLLGKRHILKCLLEIHKLFCQSDPRYILNDLYITDYCIWIQSKWCSSNMLNKLGTALEIVLASKRYANLHLQNFEYFAYLAWLDHKEEADEQQCHSTSEKHENQSGTEKCNDKVDHHLTEINNLEPLCTEFDELSVEVKAKKLK